MKYITSFVDWTRVDENLGAAKQYVIRQGAKGLKKEVGALTPEERAEILQEKEIDSIFKLTNSHPNLTLPFLRFYFEHGAPILAQGEGQEATSLEWLMGIVRNKKWMLSQLEHNFDWYASLEPKDGVSGFERLLDELRTIERAKETKWFVDGLPKALRDQWRALPKSRQAESITMALQLAELGPTVISRLFEKIKAFAHWSIEKVLEYTSNYIKGYANLELNKKISQIEQLEPEAGIVWQDERYLVLSMRTEKAQKELCAVANWCINRGQFANYADQALQFNIFDFGADPKDPYFLTGTTVLYSGNVRTSHDINDHYIKKSDDPKEHFLQLGYPEELVATIVDAVPAERLVKELVYDLKVDMLSPEDLLLTIIKQSYVVDPSTNPAVLSAVLNIVESRVKRAMTRPQVVRFYAKYGVLSKFSAGLLKLLLEGASKTEMQPIISTTLETFKRIREASRSTSTLHPKLKSVLDQEEEVMDELGRARIAEGRHTKKIKK